MRQGKCNRMSKYMSIRAAYMDPYHANWQPPMEEKSATRGVALALLVKRFQTWASVEHQSKTTQWMYFSGRLRHIVATFFPGRVAFFSSLKTACPKTSAKSLKCAPRLVLAPSPEHQCCNAQPLGSPTDVRVAFVSSIGGLKFTRKLVTPRKRIPMCKIGEVIACCITSQTKIRAPSNTGDEHE